MEGVSKTPTRGRGRGRGVFYLIFFLAIYLEIDSFRNKVPLRCSRSITKKIFVLIPVCSRFHLFCAPFDFSKEILFDLFCFIFDF